MNARELELERRADDLAREIDAIVRANDELDDALAELRDAHPYAMIVHDPRGLAHANREGVLVLEALLRGIAVHTPGERSQPSIAELPWARALAGVRIPRAELRAADAFGARTRAWKVSSAPLDRGAAITLLRDVTAFRARCAALEARRDALALEVAALGRVLALPETREDGP